MHRDARNPDAGLVLTQRPVDVSRSTDSASEGDPAAVLVEALEPAPLPGQDRRESKSSASAHSKRRSPASVRRSGSSIRARNAAIRAAVGVPNLRAVRRTRTARSRAMPSARTRSRPSPVQVDGLVGHQHLPRPAGFVALHQVDRPGAPDARPPLQAEAGQQLAQQGRGGLVDGAGVAQDPRRPRLGRPVLDAALVGPHVVPRGQRDGVAAGEVRRGGRRRRARRDGAFSARD